MASFWIFPLILVAGIAFGWLKPGKQEKGQMFKIGALIGLGLGVLLGIVGFIVQSDPFAVGFGALAIVLAGILIAALFILGVWVGDMIEARTRKTL